MTLRHSRRSIIPLVVLLFLDIAYFSLSNPTAGNSYVVVAGSFLLAISFYAILRALLVVGSNFVGLRIANQKRVAAFLAGLLIFVLLMQSINQLSLRDVLGACVLAIILYFYLSYITESSKTSSSTRAGVERK